MISLDLEKIAAITGGKLTGSTQRIEKIVTDSRKVCTQSLFCAIKGLKFDGHSFIEQAVEQGAIALMVEDKSRTNVPQIVVENTTVALGKIANYIRLKVDPYVVGITGSNGKTTVKEMTAAVLNEDNNNLLMTQGNFNNQLGVPFTLFRLNGEHDIAVIEMGANHAGEIAYLSQITQPDLAVITNIGPAHLEGFGSIEGVANAKSEIFSGLTENGIALIFGDDPYAPVMRKSVGEHRLVTFGYSNANDFYVTDIILQGDGLQAVFVEKGQRHPICLSYVGKHNALNALIAFCIGRLNGIAPDMLIRRLEGMEPIEGRLQVKSGRNGAKLIDDAYNANYQSVLAGIESLATMPGYRILVFGDMYELGEQATYYHEQVGKRANEAGVDEICTVGVLSKHALDYFDREGRHFNSREKAIEYLKTKMDDQTTVLVKGSRGVQLDKVVSALSKTLQE